MRTHEPLQTLHKLCHRFLYKPMRRHTPLWSGRKAGVLRDCLSVGIIAVPLLMASPSFALTETLKQGSRGYEVAELQQRLRNIGYPVRIDSVFGSETANAVRDVQARCGLFVDGVVGEDTRVVLNRYGCIQANDLTNGSTVPINDTFDPIYDDGSVVTRPLPSGPSYGRRWIVLVPSRDPILLSQLRRELRFGYRTLKGDYRSIPTSEFTIDRSSSRFGPFIRLASFEPADKFEAEELYRYLQRRGYRDAQMRYEPRLNL